MDLLYQTHSPYARKVLVFAHEAGLAAQLCVIHHETSPTNRNDQVFAVNPLGKVPVLVLADGEAIFDSIVICDYLETLNRHAALIPPAGARRRAALRMQAVAQGMCEAGIGLRWDTSRRPEHLRYPALAEGMKTKLIESYDYLEQATELDEPLHVGHIAVALRSTGWPSATCPTSKREGRGCRNGSESFCSALPCKPPSMMARRTTDCLTDPIRSTQSYSS